MAKKKIKKKSSLKLFNILVVALGIFSGVLFTILPMIKATLTTYASETKNMYSGIAMIFGGEATNNWTTNYGNGDNSVSGSRLVEVSFNVMACMALVLVILGALLVLVALLSKSLSKNKLVGLLASIMLLSGGVLMLTIRSSCLTALNVNEYLVDLYSLAYGAIVSGILAILAGIGNIATIALKK